MNNIFFGEFHSNLHSRHLENFQEWLDLAKEMVDFWAPVYYPYHVVEMDKGFHCEGLIPSEKYTEDWEKLRQLCSKVEDYILYMSYEWQGDGRDGDHNVFYVDNAEQIRLPLTYEQLCKELDAAKTIAIPHHPGYAPGHRGKNWATNNEELSPVTEIYSSHGCSEASDSPIPLNVHIHMGPRTEEGTVFHALKNGVKTGIIASGDNHIYSAISGNGMFGVICDEYDRDSIFKAIKKRHTYGVTRSKILLDFKINNGIMGDEIKSGKTNSVKINAVGTSAIDRIELYRNCIIEKVFTHSGTWEDNNISGKVRFKFEIELGWGPDIRVFPNISQKDWSLRLETAGELHGIEKCFTSPGCSIAEQDKNSFSAAITTRKSGYGSHKLSQKNYLQPNIQNQSLIVEISDDIENSLKIIVDNKEYLIPIRKLLSQAILEAQEAEVHKLLEDSFGFKEYYREDPWWHHAYKMLLHKASPQAAYDVNINYEFSQLKKNEDCFLVKVIQKNGDIAWSSPIWVCE